MLVLHDDDSTARLARTWFVRVTLRGPDESWPTAGGRLMWPLLQIVTDELPYRPPALADLALIRVFVNPAFLAVCDKVSDYYHPNRAIGPGWLLLASHTLDGMKVAPEPDHGSRIAAAAGSWRLVESDLPTFDDLPSDCPDEIRDEWGEFEETCQGTKVGGWPSTAQSAICWAPGGQQHPCPPEYVFQIDSHYDRGWMWGDSGFAYFGRGTGPHREHWVMEWQGY